MLRRSKCDPAQLWHGSCDEAQANHRQDEDDGAQDAPAQLLVWPLWWPQRGQDGPGLVVDLSLWKIWKSIGMMTFPIYGYIWENEIHVPVTTNQMDQDGPKISKNCPQKSDSPDLGSFVSTTRPQKLQLSSDVCSSDARPPRKSRDFEAEQKSKLWKSKGLWIPWTMVISFISISSCKFCAISTDQFTKPKSETQTSSVAAKGLAALGPLGGRSWAPRWRPRSAWCSISKHKLEDIETHISDMSWPNLKGIRLVNVDMTMEDQPCYDREDPRPVGSSAWSWSWSPAWMLLPSFLEQVGKHLRESMIPSITYHIYIYIWLYMYIKFYIIYYIYNIYHIGCSQLGKETSNQHPARPSLMTP